MKAAPLWGPVPAFNEFAYQQAQIQWTQCAHPLGGLGVLEEVIAQIAGVTGNTEVPLEPRTLFVFCADNGVVRQGISQSTSEVTRAVTEGLSRGVSSVCAMAKVARCPVVPVDMGVENLPALPGVVSCRLGNGTRDISQGPAMDRATALAAIQTGIDLARHYHDQGVQLFLSGEMGIGNTTTASAVTSVLLGLDPVTVTGRGAGLGDVALARKRVVIAQAIAVNHPDPRDPLDVVAKVGGFDIAGLCGLFIGGALCQTPVLIDGAITMAAALCAVRLVPDVRFALIGTHCSSEPSCQFLREALDLRPFICADMHLGEGTGAVAALPLLDMARALYREGATFDHYELEPYEPWGGSSC